MRRILAAVPETNRRLHCDFHEGNVMVRSGELLMIDIDETCLENPVYDLAFCCANHVFLAFEPNLLERSAGLGPKAVRQMPRLAMTEDCHTGGSRRLKKGGPGASAPGDVNRVTSSRKDIFSRVLRFCSHLRPLFEHRAASVSRLFPEITERPEFSTVSVLPERFAFPLGNTSEKTTCFRTSFLCAEPFVRYSGDNMPIVSNPPPGVLGHDGTH